MTCASRAVSVGVLIVCALGLARGSNAATITVNPPDAYGRIFVDVVGDIVLEDDKTFQAKVGRPVDPEKVIITLVGDGGDALTAGAIGDIIRLTGMNTFVPVGQRCASACAFIWLAGAERFISSNAYVGFHGIYDPHTGQQPAMPNVLMATYLGYLGFSYGAVVWMLSPRQLAIHWLTAETAKQYGIYTQSLRPPRTIPLAQPAGPPPQAPLPSNPPHQDQELNRDLYLGCTCSSACAILMFSGHHVVVSSHSYLCFHAPAFEDGTAVPKKADIVELAKDLTTWGLTQRQALALLGAAPPSGIRCATEQWAQELGFKYSVVPGFLTSWKSCATKFCLAVP